MKAFSCLSILLVFHDANSRKRIQEAVHSTVHSYACSIKALVLVQKKWFSGCSSITISGPWVSGKKLFWPSLLYSAVHYIASHVIALHRILSHHITVYQTLAQAGKLRHPLVPAGSTSTSTRALIFVGFAWGGLGACVALHPAPTLGV